MPQAAKRSSVDWSPWLVRPGAAGLVTDYDGTLAPVVEDRDQAVPVSGARDALAALARRLSVVAVVWRSLPSPPWRLA